MVVFAASSEAQNLKNKIIFSKETGAGKSNEVYLMNPDGSDVKKYIKSTVARRGEYHAHLSPDRKYVTFSTYRYPGWKIAIANSDLTNVQRLTNTPHYEYDAQWSPDGKKLVFYKVQTDGPPYFQGNMEVFTVDRDGKNQKNISGSENDDRGGSFSPDGKRILYISSANYEDYDIILTDLSGSKKTNLTNSKDSEFSASFSPDGNYIAFLNESNKEISLFKMRKDGTERTRLTEKNQFRGSLDFNNGMNWYFRTSWSPNGKQIVFNAPDENNSLDIFVIDADGKNLKQITNTDLDEMHPEWIK